MITESDMQFINEAEKVAAYATCDLLHVGCVIVKDGTIISSGWNATIPEYKPCSEAGHIMSEDGRCMRQIHAETNAVLNVSNKDDLKGAIAYVTLEPCDNCTKILNQSGISSVLFKSRFKNPFNTYFIKPMEWVCLEDLES